MNTLAAQRWRPIVEQARRSSLSIRAFARENGINPNTLAWWNWRLGKEAPEPAFLEVVVAPREARPLRMHIGPVEVEVDADTDLGLLRRLVEALT